MIVHFIAGKSRIADEAVYFRKITTAIKGSGHTLTRDWVEEVYESRGRTPDVDWVNLYHENLKAINSSDVTIAEATTKSFGVGFQSALAAIRARKPTLILVRDEVDHNSILWGVDEDTVQIKLYNDETLDAIVMKFLTDTDAAAAGDRFNLLLERRLQNYLTWSSKNNGKTRSQIIRDLISTEMRKDDY